MECHVREMLGQGFPCTHMGIGALKAAAGANCPRWLRSLDFARDDIRRNCLRAAVRGGQVLNLPLPEVWVRVRREDVGGSPHAHLGFDFGQGLVYGGGEFEYLVGGDD